MNKFKEGDAVYLDKRGLIDWETQDNTIHFSKNKAYIVQYISYDNVTVCDITMHYDHFKKADIDDGMLQGDKFFKKGDKVKLIIRGKIDWEPLDYTIIDNLTEDKIYEINNYCIHFDGRKNIRLVDGHGELHPNHFKKVENEI